MVDINVISFLLFDMLIVGLSVAAFRDIKLQSKFHNYWRLSLVCFAIGYFCFGISPYVNSHIITVANYFVVMASVFMTLLMRTWNTTVTKRLERSLFAASLLIPIANEYLNLYGSHPDRVTLIMSLLFALSIWRIYELSRLQKREPNAAFKVMLVLACIYSILSAARIVIVWVTTDSPYVGLFNEGFIAVVNRWGLSATHVMTYLAINEYYTEKSWEKEKQALEAQLSSQKIIDQLAHEINQTTELNKNLALVLKEKNKLLASLSSSMKSTRMGAMASSMAHEINQPLSAIRLNAEMALSEVEKKADLEFAKTNLRYLIEDVDRIDTIVNKIKKFFYNDDSDFKSVQLSDLVDSINDYVQDGCHAHHINLKIDVDPALYIHGDKGQLQMVLFNLIHNAMDALEQVDGPRCIEVQATKQGEQIHLSVQDNGLGVSPELSAQIFDLFKTTKPDGMGVGLWLSRAVMENHRGHLVLHNVPGGGARFVMQFQVLATSV